MSKLDSQLTVFGVENPDDPNLVRQGNPPDIESPSVVKEGGCEDCSHRDSLCANGYCLIAGGGVCETQGVGLSGNRGEPISP